MDLDRPIVVAGAGVGGLTTALALHRNGIPVRVYERRTADEIRTAPGSGLTLWSNATTPLGWLGLGEQLLANAEPVVGIHSFDPAGRPRFKMATHKHIAPGALPSLSIGRMDLAEILMSACAERGIPVRYGRRVAGFHDQVEQLTVELDGGESIPATALIGADGVRSAVATQLHGELSGIYLGRTVYRGVADGGRSDLPAGIPQLYHDPSTGVGGGVYPIGGDRVAWTLSMHAAAGDRDEDPQQLQARAIVLAQALPAVLRDRVARTPKTAIIRTDIWYHEWHERWGHGPVTTVGDAAHTMPNDLGQGACQAVEDAVVLADALAGGGDLSQQAQLRAALRDYERRRFERVRWVRDQSVTVATAPEPSHPVTRWAMSKLTRLYLSMAEKGMWRTMQRLPELTAAQTPVAAAATETARVDQ